MKHVVGMFDPLSLSLIRGRFNLHRSQAIRHLIDKLKRIGHPLPRLPVDSSIFTPARNTNP
jgi:hypothetical protein